MLDVTNRVKAAFPGIHCIIYSSRSARADLPKSRVLIPFSCIVPGADYSMIQKIINDRLQAAGLPPDRASERQGQLCYLPNKGQFYEYEIINREPLDPYQVFKSEIKAEQDRLKQEQEGLEQRRRAAIQKAQERISTGQADPVEAYNQSVSIELALSMYGYTKVGNKWISPNSESGKPGVSVKNGKGFSHHSSDAGIGQPGKNGGVWFDPFDLFVYFEHSGNYRQAVKKAGQMFTTTDPATGQTVSITKANQREYMRRQYPAGQKDLKQHAGDAGQDSKTEDWEDIIPLDAMDVEQVDPATLPGIIGEYAQAVAQETETPIELASGMLFVVLAACVQGRIKIIVKPGYSEPLAFWTFTPMPPATRKSQVLKRITQPLTDWERKQRADAEPFIQARRIERENTQARIKALRARYGKAKQDELAGISDEIRELSENMEPELVPPQIWAQDCTPENAGQIMAQSGERLTILAAEGGILDNLGGRYNSGIANLDLFLQGYSGDSVKVNRTTRDDIYLNNPALSMGLMPQPDVMRGIAEKQEFKGRGFNGRPLYFMPKSNLGSRTLNSRPIPENIKADYSRIIEKLLEIQPKEYPDGTTGPHALSLSPEAFNEWKDFYMEVEHGLADGGQFEHCRDWAGKTPGRAARLAGLLHCATNPVEPWAYPVSKQTMEQALDITFVSISHALAVFKLMGSDPAIEKADRVLKWIKRRKKPEFTKKQVFDALRGTFKRTAMLNEPLDVLSDRNYIRLKEDTPKKRAAPSLKFTDRKILSS